MLRSILRKPNHGIHRPKVLPNFSTMPCKKQAALITDFHHIKLLTGSAKATRDLFINKFNFTLNAFSGPETGNKETLDYLVSYGNAKIIISSPLGNNTYSQKFMNNYLSRHGDGIADIAFLTNNIDDLQKNMRMNTITNDLQSYDNYQTITYQAHETHSNLTHTFIELNEDISNDVLFPNYQFIANDTTDIMHIDHTVINMRENEIIQTTKWYEECLNFHQFWAVDEDKIHTDNSSLKSIVMTNETETIKIPINEPGPGEKESQIQEFINEYDGPGVQHIALRVPNIIEYVTSARARGLQFLESPSESYYEEVSERLELNNIQMKEDINVLQSLGILVDCDENGYLLQIFTECIVDRPTLFFEIIQRNNNNGFGEGNFKTLFEIIEREQQKRGNLKPYKKSNEFPNILGLHHYAYKCKNLEETIHFYRDILDLPYVHKLDKDYVPSTEEYKPYTHIFFQLRDGSHIAFFDTYDNKIATYNCDDWINHISFNVESLEDLNKAKERLMKNKIDVIGPTKHDDFITSIYFFDPNGLRLELTYQHASLQTLDHYQESVEQPPDQLVVAELGGDAKPGPLGPLLRRNRRLRSPTKLSDAASMSDSTIPKKWKTLRFA